VTTGTAEVPRGLKPASLFLSLFLFLLAARLCHTGLVWVEEAYPAAGAIQMLAGKTIYRNFWFDKPPLTPLVYLAWGGHAGVALRFAGAVFAVLCCWAAYRVARGLWSEREGRIAAALTAFFLTFDVPSAVMVLAPDLFMLLPHFGAVYLASRRRAFASGAVAGLAMLINPKAVLILPVCLLWCWREWIALAGGFAAVNGAAFAVLAGLGALWGYFEQVWAWGTVYSRDTFVAAPLAEGVRRTSAWLGFHAAIVIAAGWYWLRERSANSMRTAAWALIALAGVVLGWRFFPRYYFLLLPAVVIAASRGFTLLPKSARVVAALLLVIPLARFGPRYVLLARDGIAGRQTHWADLAMNQDSRRAADLLLSLRAPGDTLLVWGYRPDIFVYTRMPAGTPFLDSQPLTGVIADRHLTQSEVSAPQLAERNRRLLTQYWPEFIVDGLGPYNPRLAIGRYSDLAPWLAGYSEAGRTSGSVIYRRRIAIPANSATPISVNPATAGSGTGVATKP
jgi:hypothetical protein